MQKGKILHPSNKGSRLRPNATREAPTSTRWASSAKTLRGKWERGPPIYTKTLVSKTPNVVHLAAPEANGSCKQRAQNGRTSVRLNEDIHRRKSFSKQTRPSTSEGRAPRTYSGGNVWERRLHSRSVGDASEINDGTQSVISYASTYNSNVEKYYPREKDIRDINFQGCHHNDNGKRSYPKSYAFVQEMVQNLREKRTPSVNGLKSDRSGLTQLSIQGRKDFIDPVLAWSNLNRTDGEYPFDKSSRRKTVPTGSIETTKHLQVSSDDDDDSLISSDDDTMDTVSISPFMAATVADEEEENYRNSEDYNKRTGQILNYYAEKDKIGEQPESRNHHQHPHHQGRSPEKKRHIPSVTNFYRNLVSELAKDRDSGHFRSFTAPAPTTTPVRRAPSVDTQRSNNTGRVFMGRRVYPPQKIEAALRPKPMPKRGKSFVQIHKPAPLLPRSKTMDYSFRTCSVLSNSFDDTDNDNDNVIHTPRREQSNAFLTEGMENLSIVGKSLHKKDSKAGASKKHNPGLHGKANHFFRPIRRSSSNILKARSEVHTQMETISPPYSSESSTNYMGMSSRANMNGFVDDLTVYNNVNPSPRSGSEDNLDPLYCAMNVDTPLGGSNHPLGAGLNDADMLEHSLPGAQQLTHGQPEPSERGYCEEDRGLKYASKSRIGEAKESPGDYYADQDDLNSPRSVTYEEMPNDDQLNSEYRNNSITSKITMGEDTDYSSLQINAYSEDSYMGPVPDGEVLKDHSPVLVSEDVSERIEEVNRRGYIEVESRPDSVIGTILN